MPSHLIRRLFALAALALFVATAPAFAADPPRRLNVLFIAVDDMNNDLGCYGHPLVRSPNIDRLAQQGTRFEKAYCQFPLCSPSRVSVMTGLRPDVTKIFDLATDFRKQTLPDVVTLSQTFMNHGYFAARVGKIYHYGNPGQIGTSGLDDPQSWKEVVNPKGVDKIDEAKITNLTPKRGLGSSLSLWATDEDDAEHTDAKVADAAIRLMETHKAEPFFIAAGFYRPHCPYVAPKKYFELYPLEKLAMPAATPEIKGLYPAPALSSTSPWPWFGVGEQEALRSVQAYYATISLVDTQVGRLLDAVERLGLADSTVIVFWSDHGYHLGQHGLWMKQSLFEQSARVPLIISAPGQKTKGQASPRTVELIDLHPTLADLAGLKPPADLPGKSLKALLDDPAAAWDKPAITQVWRGQFPGYSIRTERYRYTEWDHGRAGRELYDYETDPQESSNKVDQADYATVVADLQGKLQAISANGYRPTKGKKGAGK